MKIKNIVFSGFAAAILTSAANAAIPFQIASKAYVDGKFGNVPVGSDVMSEINSKADADVVGDLDDLTTTEDGSIVGAINELDSAIDDKQDKLGGSGHDGQVVTATSNAGSVTYTTIDSSIPTTGNGTSNLVTSAAVKTYVDDAIDGATGGGSVATLIADALGDIGTHEEGGQQVGNTVQQALALKQNEVDSNVTSTGLRTGTVLTTGHGVATNLKALDTELGLAEGRITDIETIVGDGTTSGVAKDVADLKDIVNGDGTNPGLVDDVADLDEQINGDPTDNTNNGLVGDVADLDEAINGNGSSVNGLLNDVSDLQALTSILEGFNDCVNNSASQHCVLTAYKGESGQPNGMMWVDVTDPFESN